MTRDEPGHGPLYSLHRAAGPIDGPADRIDPSGPPARADACPAANVGMLNSAGGSIVGSTIGSVDDFDASVLGCGDNPGGQDEIFQFTVDGIGLWSFDTCTVPACWDTTLSIREETGRGCPGDFVACDGDGCSVGDFESRLATFLLSGPTYYLIVDGWNTFAYGDFEVTYENKTPACKSDADCYDGVFCNGTETCDVATGQCVGGTPPCTTYEGYSAPCDGSTDTCTKPHSCLTWMADTMCSCLFLR